jgi:hypothetical protein
MKKLAIVMLGFGLALGSVTAAFAQETKKESTKKKSSKKKKSEPTKKEG